MLGTLAKWLRIFGFDTFYADAITNDDEILDIAKKENRILITRDRELIQKARRDTLKIVEIKTVDLNEQLNCVLGEIDIDKKLILSRCTICNSILEEVKKNEVRDKVPEKVFVNNNVFWFCPNCNKFYWRGSHYDKMINKVDEVKKI